MTSAGNWRNLEQRVAKYFERNGYTARTNQIERGRSGLAHEIDVLAEKRDAAGTHRVAVECKAWRSPVEKDVIYKLEKVMQDAGLSKGIVVSVGGLRSGARVAAEQAHIDVWGPDEIRHYLGEEALAGLPLAAPDEALGVEVTISRDAAEREIRKARGGFAGIGTEEIASIDLLWVPAVELQLAVTRVRPGIVKDRDEVIRRWNLFEALTGRMVGQREDPRAFVTVALVGPTVCAQKSSPQIVSDMRRTLGKHRNAKSEAAQKTRQAAYNAIGLLDQPASSQSKPRSRSSSRTSSVSYDERVPSGSWRSTLGWARARKRSSRRCTKRSTSCAQPSTPSSLFRLRSPRILGTALSLQRQPRRNLGSRPRLAGAAP